MIITAIVQAIKSFFAAIGKVIAWLLTALGLWVPLLYSVIFLIVIAIAGIPIETTGTAYFLGLFVSLGLALWISMAVSARKNKTKKEKKVDYNVAEAKKKNRKSVPDENITVNSPQPVGSATQVTGDVLQSAVPPSQPQMQQGYIQQQNGYAQAYGQYPAHQPSYQQPMPPQQNYTQQQAMPAQNGFVPYTMPSQYPPQRPQNSDTFAPYDGVSTSEKADGLGYAGYSYPQNPTQYVFTEEQKRSATYYADRAAATYDEKPRIFRLRSNPNMLVYEYSDRLDYYKKDGDYRQFLYSEKKR